jgi:hypothetical protein
LRIVFLQHHSPFLFEALFNFFEAFSIYRFDYPFEVPMVSVPVVVSNDPPVVTAEYQMIDVS